VATTAEGKAQVVRTFDALRAGVAVDGTTGRGFNKIVAYDSNGFARGKAGGFGGGCLTFKAETGRRSSIVVSVAGRPKVCDPDKKGDCGSGACGR